MHFKLSIDVEKHKEEAVASTNDQETRMDMEYITIHRIEVARKQVQDYERNPGPLALPLAEPVEVMQLGGEIETVMPQFPTHRSRRPQEWLLGNVGVDWRVIRSWRQPN